MLLKLLVMAPICLLCNAVGFNTLFIILVRNYLIGFIGDIYFQLVASEAWEDTRMKEM